VNVNTILHTTYTNQTASDVTELTDESSEVISALVRAEKFGTARVGGVTIAHTGYVSGATEFNAGTALFRVSW
jgi:hypothetical protein